MHEIDDDGNIVYLTDISTIPQVDLDEEALKALPPPPEAEGRKLFTDLLGEEQTNTLFEYSKTADTVKECFKV